MRLASRHICCIAALFYHAGLVAQSPARADTASSVHQNRVADINPRTYKRNDTTWIYSGICKPLQVKIYTGREPAVPVAGKIPAPRFISIHGSVQYDFLYRSFADTPYYQKDFRQHSLRASLHVILKNGYPVHLNFLVRESNSPFFRNFVDGGLRFDSKEYENLLRQQIGNKVLSAIQRRPDLDIAEKALEKLLNKYEAVKDKLNSDGLSQRLIEEREKEYFRQTVNSKYSDFSEKDIQGAGTGAITVKAKRELDSLANSITRLTTFIDSVKNDIARSAAVIRKKLYKATTVQELNRLAEENGAGEKKRGFGKLLADLKTAGVGRSVLNYSELTVSNVSLTGVNAEYNPRIYAALAAGKIDYGFRDFFGKNAMSSNQHLFIGRFGWGDKDKKAIIFSLFTGRKSNYGGVLSDTIRSHFPVTGYSFEAIVKKDEWTGITMEMAKTTVPVTGRYTDNKGLESLFRFSDKSNLGVSIKGQTRIPETKTTLKGFFRKTGEHFQSFSLFSYNTDQTAWMLKAEQAFAKDKITIHMALRRNDFVNPLTEKTFKTSTVFKSAQVQVRIPKWPSVSAGYYPGSQLYIIDRDRVRENVYYILNGTVIHTYKLFGVRMVSSAIYNSYSNKGTDSGFINYSGINYVASHSVVLKNIQLQGSFIYTDQQELKFYSIENNVEYSAERVFRIGAGLKYNKINGGGEYWGGGVQLMAEIKRLGILQLQYEKSFLPTIQQTLFPVEVGRVSWIKYF